MSGAPETSTGPDAHLQELMRAGRMDEARKILADRLRVDPDNTETLYLSAVCARFERSHAEAAGHLERLLQQSPEDSRALQELGHLHRDQGQDAAAVAAYARALNANPALLASYDNRIRLLRSLGRDREAAAAEAARRRTASLPKALLATTDLLAQGRIARAEELCRAFLRREPRHTEGMRLLAEIAVRFGALEEAQFLLETACELQPADTVLRIELIRVLGRRQRFSESLAQAERLLQDAPQNLQFQSLRAIELLQLGRYDEAIAGFDEILRALPGDPVTLVSRGHALKTLGDTDTAIGAYEAASSAAAASGEAWYALANLKTYRFSDAQIGAMRARLDDRAPLMDQVYLSFALGKACEDSADYEQSFAYYERGNRLKSSQVGYRAETFSREVDAQIEFIDRALLEQLSGVGCTARDPIFVLGMPRAGSTLLEQILATHTAIEGTRELPNVLSLAQRLRRRPDAGGDRPGYPQVLASLDADTLQSLGRDYLEQTRIHRTGAPFFIDKMPNNFRHIGLIHLMLPNARIIDARREPMACCFSNFKQLFAEGQEFSYDLVNLGRYYRDYERLMMHWDTVLPGRVHRVQHEDLVDDIEGELQRLFAYLQIPFEEQCLRFYENDRPVRTPSSEQVRQPLFRNAREQWQNYQSWLDPLAAALKG